MSMFDAGDFAQTLVDEIHQPIVPQWVEMQLETQDFATDIVGAIQTALIPGAITVGALFFFLSLMELGMSERMTPELLVKTFAKLAICIFLVNISFELFKFGSAAANWAQDAIKQGLQSPGKDDDAMWASALEALKEAVKGLSIWERILLWINLNMFQGIMKIASAFIATTLISRQIEIIVRGSFMPIAMSFVTVEGWNSGAIRYLKKMIALFLQGPAIMVVFSLATTIYLQAVTNMIIPPQNWTSVDAARIAVEGGQLNGFNLFACGLAVMIGIIGAVRGTQQVVNDVMGA